MTECVHCSRPRRDHFGKLNWCTIGAWMDDFGRRYWPTEPIDVPPPPLKFGTPVPWKPSR